MNEDLQDDRWTRLQQRLRRSMLALEETERCDDRHRQSVYRQRALRLASVGRSRASAPSLLTETLTFALGDQQYGLPLCDIAKVFPLLPCTPVPLASPWLVGVANFDSHIRSVLDLRMLLQSTSAVTGTNGSIVLIRGQRLMIGALVERVIGVQTLDFATLTVPEHVSDGPGGRLIRGASPEGLMLICTDALATRITTAGGASLEP